MTDFPWPKKDDVAFGTGQNPDFQLPMIAIIDRFVLHPSSTIHSDAFREAADRIIDTIRDGEYLFSSDKFFLPIAYLYRHAIELALKEALEYALRLELVEQKKQAEKALGNHNLNILWSNLKPALLEFWSGCETESPAAAEGIISQFHELDGSGQAFRYPREKDGRPSLNHAENVPREVDLLQLRKVAEGLCAFLGGCISGFDEALSNMPTNESGW